MELRFNVYLQLFIILKLVTVRSINFAYLDNDLYVNYDDQMDDRGFQSIWGLWQLHLRALESNIPIPDAVIKINGDATDFWRNVGQGNP